MRKKIGDPKNIYKGMIKLVWPKHTQNPIKYFYN